MSYHEHDLSRHSISVSYGATWNDWTLLLSVGFGGSGAHERGVSISLLCFWFALHWWPLDYPVPESARVGGDGSADWDKGFDRVNDVGYQIEAADLEASSIVAMAQRLRNVVDVLRDLHYAKSDGGSRDR
jgi:hypothetical protein